MKQSKPEPFVTVRLPKSLAKDVTVLAKKTKRSRENYVQWVLAGLVLDAKAASK